MLLCVIVIDLTEITDLLRKGEVSLYRGGSITVQLTSCFICLDSAALLMLN